MKLSSSPDEQLVLRLEQRKSFSFAVVFRQQNGKPVDITGATLTLDFLANLAKLQRPEDIVPADIVTISAIVFEPVFGFARFNIQADDLDLNPGSYPYTITLRTADGYSMVVAKGEIELQLNVEHASQWQTYPDNASVDTLDVTLRGMQVVRLLVGAQIPPKMNWLSDEDQRKLDVIKVADGDIDVDLSNYATSAEAQAWDAAVLASAAAHADSGDVSTLAAAAAHADSGDTDLLTAIDGKAAFAHTHNASAVTAGVLDPARLPQQGLRLPGETVAYAGATVPAGWLLCDGAAVLRADFPALFAAIGTLWGPGNGTTTFNVPDFRERFLAGAPAFGLGLTGTGGESMHILTEAEMPSHTHTLGTDGVWMYGGSTANLASPGLGQWGFRGTTSQPTGGGLAHNNVPPFRVVNYIIKT